MKTALILDHRLEAVADAELFMENASAVVDMRSIVAMLNAKLIKISTRRHLKPRFLAHLSAFFRSNTKTSHHRADKGYIIDHERINTIRWCYDYSEDGLFAIVIPGGLLIGYYFGPQCTILTLVLSFMPSIFCKLRYTTNHREALRCHYGKLKHPGRKLTIIILCCIALTIVNLALTRLITLL